MQQASATHGVQNTGLTIDKEASMSNQVSPMAMSVPMRSVPAHNLYELALRYSRLSSQMQYIEEELRARRGELQELVTHLNKLLSKV